jgi:hypothetical protein
MEEASSNKTGLGYSPLCLKDLSKYFPKEIREKIYMAYLQPPRDNFVNPNANRLLNSIAVLQDTDPELFDEIIFVVKRISSVPQHVLLKSHPEKGTGFGGFPKQLMTMTDWLSVRYVVIKIVYYDCSIRNEFDDISQPVYISVRHEMGVVLNRIKTLQHNNPHLGQLTKIRYDMLYDESHADEKDNADTEDVDDGSNLINADNSKKKNLVIPLSELITMFPLAKTVWAEPTGSIKNKRALQTIRAFNMGRRVFERCNPCNGVLRIVTCMAAKGVGFNAANFITGEDENCVKEAVKFIKLVKEADWMVKNGINFEILCLGCQATFKGDRPVAYFPEEGCLTRRLFKEHCLRSTRNHGPTAPCAYRGRQYVEVHYG